MKAEDFEGIVAGLEDAIAFAGGDATRARIVSAPDVRSIRTRRRLTQTAFAKAYHFPLRTIQDWEQGRRQPDAGSATLLKMIEADPLAVEQIIAKIG